MPTPHIAAEAGDFAETVLLPGDPRRAKFVADTFLDDVSCINEVRNMLGYTGHYQGFPVSVMGTGMGIPRLPLGLAASRRRHQRPSHRPGGAACRT